MTNTASASVAQIKKAEEDSAKMIAQAQKTRDEKTAKKQDELQKQFVESEEKFKESARLEITQYKNEASDKGKQIVHDAQQEAGSLKTNLETRVKSAVEKGINVLNKFLGLTG